MDSGIIHTGYCSSELVSYWLQSCDIYLAPFVDGLTARRGSVIAALSHGLAIVSNKGPLFDAAFYENSPISLAPNTSPDQFLPLVSHFLSNEKDLAIAKELGRAFFEEHLTWSLITSKILNHPFPTKSLDKVTIDTIKI